MHTTVNRNKQDELIKLRLANDRLVSQLSKSLQFKVDNANKQDDSDERSEDLNSSFSTNQATRRFDRIVHSDLNGIHARTLPNNSGLVQKPAAVSSMTQDLNLLERLLSKSNAFSLPLATNNNNNNNKLYTKSLTTSTTTITATTTMPKASLNSDGWLLLQTANENEDDNEHNNNNSNNQKWSRNENPSSKINHQQQQQHQERHKWIHSRLAGQQTRQDGEVDEFSGNSELHSDKRLSVISRLNNRQDNFTTSELANLVPSKQAKLPITNYERQANKSKSVAMLQLVYSHDGKTNQDHQRHYHQSSQKSNNDIVSEQNDDLGYNLSDSDDSNDHPNDNSNDDGPNEDDKDDDEDEDDDDDDDVDCDDDDDDNIDVVVMELPSCDWLHSKDNLAVSTQTAGNEYLANNGPAKFYETCDELPECEWAGQCKVDWIYSWQKANKQNEFKQSDIGLTADGNRNRLSSKQLSGWSRISRARCQCPIGRGGLLCQRSKLNSTQKLISM